MVEKDSSYLSETEAGRSKGNREQYPVTQERIGSQEPTGTQEDTGSQGSTAQETVLSEIDSQSLVATVVLNNEAKRNALDLATIRGIRAGVEHANEAGCRVILVTGKGSVFCSGGDLSGAVFSPGFLEELQAMLRAIEDSSALVIASINGAAVGAGCQLAMACDLRVASSSAFFQIPAVRYSFALDNWTIRRLESLIGGGHARSVIFAAEKIDAGVANGLGLVNRRGGWNDAVAWAKELAVSAAPLAIKYSKLVFNADGTSDTATTEQSEAATNCWRSKDLLEARNARAEGRRPVFRGH